jgi:hypothetical protein
MSIEYSNVEKIFIKTYVFNKKRQNFTVNFEKIKYITLSAIDFPKPTLI